MIGMIIWLALAYGYWRCCRARMEGWHGKL